MSLIRQRLHTLAEWFNQSEWVVRLLSLSRAEEPRDEPGLVLIQIDGLGYTEFLRKLQAGRLPFVKRLGGKAHGYTLTPHYSGLPSNTPGVQGALFYGVDGCVPAFSFLDRASGKVCHMFDPATAGAVEERLQRQGQQPLLSGGSSYGNIFAGGAATVHFCSTSLGWVGLLKQLNPFQLTLALLFNLHTIWRSIVMAILEFLLAVVDFGKGVVAGRRVLLELSHIPMRVAICVVLREAVVAGAQIDIARGLRVIHINLASYDEQAHQRGPGSVYAQWSLRGIDSAIGHIWRAATRASRRDYQVWIYSDHGQEATVPYPDEHGRTIDTAVAEVFEQQLSARGWGLEQAESSPHWRASLLLGGRRPPGPDLPAPDGASPKVLVAAMGPLGHIYTPQPLEPEAQAQLAEALVAKAHIPLVMVKTAAGQAQAWTPAGAFELPKDTRRILGDHPYLDDIAKDLVALCHHPDAGDFVISGWRQGKPGTFPRQFGSHAGPGPAETNGFAYLPPGALTLPDGRRFVRNHDLRTAALRLLRRA